MLNEILETEDSIQVYPGKFIRIGEYSAEKIPENIDISLNPITPIYISEKYTAKKVIILDLDETIGSFSDFYKLWSILDDLVKHENPKESLETYIKFHELLSLYPEFFRHGILHILEFLYHKKRTNLCHKIYLYTNNQILLRGYGDTKSPTKWVSFIIDYLTRKICPKSKDFPLFDQLICAFKINKKQIELKRTTSSKTHSDFIRCTVLPKRTEICFIDDIFHPGMSTDKVYYIQPKAYVHYLQPDEIITRFIESTLFQNIPSEYREDIISELNDGFGYSMKTIITKSEIAEDIKISRKLFYYIREFFYLTTKKQKTRKMRERSKNSTKKSR